MKRVTIKNINYRIDHLGYELVKGRGYFHFASLDYKEAPCLYDSMVCTYHLSSYTIEEWISILHDRINETNNH